MSGLTRRGFTLWELVLVLSLMAVIAGLTLPAFTSLGMTPRPEPADAVRRLLRDARRLATARGATVSVILDPTSSHYRVYTIGGAGGAGTVVDTTLALAPGTTLVADSARVRFVFFPTGAATGDSLVVRANGVPLVVKVDPWSGVADADSR